MKIKKFFLALVALLTLVSLQCHAQKSLEQILQEFNATCPEQVDDSMTMVKATSEDGNLVLYFDFIKGYIDLAEVTNSHATKQMLVLTLIQKGYSDLGKVLKNRNIGLGIKLTEKPSGKSAMITVSSSEWESMSKASLEDAQIDYLFEDITRQYFPAEIIEGIVMTRLVREHKTAIFDCTVENEQEYPIEMLRMASDDLRQVMRDGYKEEMVSFKQMGLDAAMRITGKKSGESFTIKL